ncbi:phosphatase PAP2 family protein [Halobacteriovorax sp. HLS]|uniref:phosphatase PAP2 family protein n=1 Tax=Halobacteriovorax sp. HLS TaxID=2234000 RepID=UPI0013E3A61F|nr:phosphatase PAP2 family protein [Halobacteriovorax sp. HLS]
MLKKSVLIISIFLSLSSYSKEQIGLDAWSDIKTSFNWLLKGSLEQFTTQNNLYYAAASVPALWYSFEEDDRLSDHARTKSIPKQMELAGDFGVVLSFPIVQTGFYIYGRSTKNNHHVQFAMEYVSSMYLALAESALLSLVDVHQRPDGLNLSKWETGFRGDSSFPSGHVIPYYGLFFKTLQFYGPYWSIAPAILSIWTAQQRVRSGKHYTSDVVGSFFLMAFASEGVRKAAGYSKNHSFYKWIFEHEATLSVIEHKNVYGPKVVWKF